MFDEIFKAKLNEGILIPFLMGGVPSLSETEKLASTLIESGVTILELGVPFSDPGADGVVLQNAAEVALSNKVNLSDVLGLANKIHEKYPQVAIVIFTYLNPLLAYGLENYVKTAKSCGVAATLTVDLPVEEADEYLKFHRQENLKTVFLASSTTSIERLKKINEASSAFVYFVSRNGVTGEQNSLSDHLEGQISKIKEVVTRPLVVGFGISNQEQFKTVSKMKVGVVIGSAFMRIILETKDDIMRLELVRKLAHSCLT
ncbi:MAG: tryptophan synthase subunit alpha [Bacteriovoracaceae bacterium]|nr:tryptophan synthase subunit alpha [Bacteriovoracaceae bacterium]